MQEAPVGTLFQRVVDEGHGPGRVLLSVPSEEHAMFATEGPQPPVPDDGRLQVPSIWAALGCGELAVGDEGGIVTETWSDSGTLVLTGIGMGRWSTGAGHTDLEVTESPDGSDAYLLVRDGALFGIVWLQPRLEG